MDTPNDRSSMQNLNLLALPEPLKSQERSSWTYRTASTNSERIFLAQEGVSETCCFVSFFGAVESMLQAICFNAMLCFGRQVRIERDVSCYDLYSHSNANQ